MSINEHNANCSLKNTLGQQVRYKKIQNFFKKMENKPATSATDNSVIGENLRAVRLDLGLSQAAFAKLVGVSFSSQRRYERGDSFPDTEYLASLKRCGIDVDFVLRGTHGTSPMEFEYLKVMSGYQAIIFALGARLGRDFESIRDVVEYPQMIDFIQKYDESIPTWLVDLFFEGCSLDVDPVLLSTVIEGVEVATSKGNMIITPNKKAQAISMLYRAFKASGKVDQAMIEETVKLASS